MKNRKRIFLALAGSLLAVAVVAGSFLGGAMMAGGEKSSLGMDYGGMPSFGSMNSSGASKDVGFAVNDTYMPPEPEESIDYEATGDTGNVADNRKLVRTASVKIETMDYAGYTGWLSDYIEANGGYYSSTEALVNEAGWNPSTREPYEYQIFRGRVQIPESRLDDFMIELETQDMGRLTYSTQNVEDITQQYSDTDAHLESIRIEQQRLQELMARADTVDEILQIEDRLSYVRYEIERYERQLRDYDGQIAYSTVSFEIREVVEYVEPEPEGFVQRCVDGIKENFEAVGEFLQDAGVYLFSHIPAFVLIGAVLFVVARFGVRRWKNRKSRRAVSAGDDGETK